MSTVTQFMLIHWGWIQDREDHPRRCHNGIGYQGGEFHTPEFTMMATKSPDISWGMFQEKPREWLPEGIYIYIYQWIGLRENLQENPIFNGKIYGFL